MDTRYGLLLVPDTEADVIGSFLARYGEWAWDEARFVASVLPASGARVFDGGAFVGTFGLGLAQCRTLDFLCFAEANPTVRPFLASNIAQNSRVPSEVINVIVAGDGAAVTTGHAEAGNLGSTSYVAGTGADTLTAERIPPCTATLLELRNRYGDFDLVKLDIEGMELDVLRSDATHLSRGDTTIWVECNESPTSLEVGKELLSWGLPVYYFAFPSYNPDNFKHDPDPIFPFAYEAGLLAAPRAVPVLDNALRAHRCILRPITTVETLKAALWHTPRWGMSEWTRASREEVVALAGRAIRGETYEDYLRPELHSVGASGGLPGHRVVDEALRRAEALAFERLEQYEAERERRERAEEHLQAAESLAAKASARSLDLLACLGAERERADNAESALRAAQFKAEQREGIYAILRATLSEKTQILADLTHSNAELERLVSESAARTAVMERQAELAEVHRARLTHELSLVRTSTMWRMGAPLRHLLGARPRLHRLLRQVLAVAFKSSR